MSSTGDILVAGALDAAGFKLGEVVRINGNRKVVRVQGPAVISGPIGVVLGDNFVFSGIALVAMESGLVLSANQPLFVSTTQLGKATNVVNANPFAVIYDTALYASQGLVRAILGVPVSAFPPGPGTVYGQELLSASSGGNDSQVVQVTFPVAVPGPAPLIVVNATFEFVKGSSDTSDCSSAAISIRGVTNNGFRAGIILIGFVGGVIAAIPIPANCKLHWSATPNGTPHGPDLPLGQCPPPV